MDSEVTFSALFQTAYPALIRFARHRGLNQSGAEDLVAGTLEIAWAAS
jgi:DNA-directed RNA polymerase specialized sigma24 family protein